MSSWISRWLEEWFGGDDPSGPWPMSEESKSVNDWFF